MTCHADPAYSRSAIISRNNEITETWSASRACNIHSCTLHRDPTFGSYHHLEILLFLLFFTSFVYVYVGGCIHLCVEDKGQLVESVLSTMWFQGSN